VNPFQKEILSKPSAIGLLIANVVPLLGVLLLGWSTFAVVALYWAENIVIGLINVLRMICCLPSFEEVAELENTTPTTPMAAMKQAIAKQSKQDPLSVHISKLFMVPFFAVHYGFFCFVHGIFVFALLGDDFPFTSGPSVGNTGFFSLSTAFDRFTADQLWWGVAALSISHLVSFFSNYIGGGEYRRTVPPILMFQPYARIVVLHIAILFGAFATVAIGSPVFVLVLLIVGKTILDLSLHVVEHRKTFSGAAVTG